MDEPFFGVQTPNKNSIHQQHYKEEIVTVVSALDSQFSD